MSFESIVRLVIVLLFGTVALNSSLLQLTDKVEKVRAFTRHIEFDYVTWTLDALQIKLFEASLGTARYLSLSAHHRLVLEYLALIEKIQSAERDLELIYASPEISNPALASAPLREKLSLYEAQRQKLAPLAESILQEQISYVISQLGLSFLGQPVPPVLYHTTSLPLALIVSPREVIRQDANISLTPELSLNEQVALEERVDHALNVSSLVVKIGGVGTYPTMVQQTSNLDWLSEVVAHEWVHNYLTLHPLGMSYMSSAELRTMNETAASIAGKEIAQKVLEIFYPELLPSLTPPPPPPPSSTSTPESQPPAFDFRKEMYLTRVTVDRLLAEGKIEEAEAYMEMRRRIFWENGYRHLRKLNQAYFAFYGAYADVPIGAAGEDPVGDAVRALREHSPSLAAFLKRIAWMWSYEQLQATIAKTAP